MDEAAPPIIPDANLAALETIEDVAEDAVLAREESPEAAVERMSPFFLAALEIRFEAADAVLPTRPDTPLRALLIRLLFAEGSVGFLHMVSNAPVTLYVREVARFAVYPTIAYADWVAVENTLSAI